MSREPIVSVVVAAYNCERYVETCIRSLLEQTFSDFEILVYDDCSTDGTALVLETLAATDERIRFRQLSQNVGQTVIANLGIHDARGKYIARLDSDDLCRSDRFEVQSRYLDAHPDVFMIGTSYDMIDREGAFVGAHEVEINPAVIAKALPHKNQFCHSSVMFRREGCGFYREKFRYAQDYDFFLCKLSEGKVLQNLPEKLVWYRVAGASVSFSRAVKQVLFARRSQAFFRERMLQNCDGYDDWDASEILNLDVGNTREKEALLVEFHSRLSVKEFAEARLVMKRYINAHGVLSRGPLLWFATLPKQHVFKWFSVSSNVNTLRVRVQRMLNFRSH